MTVIQVATIPSIDQATTLNNAKPTPAGVPPPKTITFNNGGGGVKNIPFVERNADAATVFATFWLETIEGPPGQDDFLQLQYVQTVFLNFPVFKDGRPVSPVLSWPHVSVATLTQTFGGQ